MILKFGNACGINGYMIREIRRKDCRSRTVLFCYHMNIEHELCFKFMRRRSGYEPTNRADGNLPVEHEDQPDTAAASHAGTRRGKPDRKRPAGTNRTHRGTAQHRRTSARTKRQTELQAADAGTPGTKYRIAAVAAKLWKEGAKLRCIRRNGKPRNDRDNGGKSIPECEYRRRQSRGYE